MLSGSGHNSHMSSGMLPMEKNVPKSDPFRRRTSSVPMLVTRMGTVLSLATATTTRGISMSSRSAEWFGSIIPLT